MSILAKRLYKKTQKKNYSFNTVPGTGDLTYLSWLEDHYVTGSMYLVAFTFMLQNSSESWLKIHNVMLPLV